MAMSITEYMSMIKRIKTIKTESTESNVTWDAWDSCQCCLSRTSRGDFKKMSANSYQNMLFSCFSIVIENSAGVDCLICDICISRLEESHRFKCQVENSQVRLKEALNNAIEQKYSKEDQFCDAGLQNETDEITVQDVKIEFDENEKLASKSNITEIKEKTTNKPNSGDIHTSLQMRVRKMLQSDLRSIKKGPQKHINIKRIIVGSHSSTFIKNHILKMLPQSSREQNINQENASEFNTLSKQEEKIEKPNGKTIKNRSNTDIMKVKRLKKNNSITIESNKAKLNLETAEKKPQIEIKNITIDKSRTCDVCGELFPNYLSKRKHINIHYPKYICDQCGKAFINFSSMNNHVKAHANNTSPCSECGRAIKNQSMKVHMATHFPRTGKYPCSQCNLKLNTLMQRINHMKTVHDKDIYTYICKLCPKKFPTSTQLNKHVSKSHFFQLRYYCDMCGKGFHHKNHLREHIGVHTGIKNEICDICSKGFVKRWNMQQHRKCHFKNNSEKVKGRSVKDKSLVENKY